MSLIYHIHWTQFPKEVQVVIDLLNHIVYQYLIQSQPNNYVLDLSFKTEFLLRVWLINFHIPIDQIFHS